MFKLSEELLKLFKSKIELCPIMPINSTVAIEKNFSFDCNNNCSAVCENSCNGGCDREYKWL